MLLLIVTLPCVVPNLPAGYSAANPDANHYDAGVAYDAAGLAERSIDAFRSQCNFQKTVVACTNLGVAYYRAKRYELAHWALNDADAMDPGNALVARNMELLLKSYSPSRLPPAAAKSVPSSVPPSGSPRAPPPPLRRSEGLSSTAPKKNAASSETTSGSKASAQGALASAAVRAAFDGLRDTLPFPAPEVVPSGASAIRACLVYLATHDQYVAAVESSLATVQRHFFTHHRLYPVLVFITSAVSEAQKQSLTSAFPAVDVRFVIITTPSSLCPDKARGVCWHDEATAGSPLPPDWKTCKVDLDGTPGQGPFPDGYVHMGGFFLYELFTHESLKAFDFIWRLDSDLLLLAPVHRDPFVQLDATPTTLFLRPDKLAFVDSHCLPIGLRATVASTAAVLKAVHKKTRDPVTGEASGGEASGGKASGGERGRGEHGALEIDISRLNGVVEGQAWEGCTAAMRLSFFRSRSFLQVAKAVYLHRDRFRHRWSEQVFFPLALAALAPTDAVADLDIVTAGCHGDHPGALEAAMGRLHCENGQSHAGMAWMARALNASATSPQAPQHVYHTIYAANYGACSIDHVDSVVRSASELLIYAHAHANTAASRSTATQNLRALAQKLQMLATSVGQAASNLNRVAP